MKRYVQSSMMSPEAIIQYIKEHNMVDEAAHRANDPYTFEYDSVEDFRESAKSMVINGLFSDLHLGYIPKEVL